MLNTNVFRTVSQVSPIYLKNQVLCANVFHRFSWGTGRFSFIHNQHVLCAQVSPIDHKIGLGFGWVSWGERFVLSFSTRLLNEFPDWLLFNCRTQLKFSLWSNRDRVSMRSLVVVEEIRMIFSNKTSPVLHSHNFWNTISWKCSLKDNCIRSCLIEC